MRESGKPFVGISARRAGRQPSATRKVHMMDLTFLRPLFDRPGPWASVYLDASRDSENADRQVDLRWRALRERLVADGADPDTVEAVQRAVQEHPTQPGRYGLAVFATGGETVLVEPLPRPPAADEATFGPLPHAMPLVAQRGEEVPYVRVLADRTGADLDALGVGGAARHREVTGGETFPLRKVNAGGWSHRRYQMAAEEAWRRNADDSTLAAVELAETVGAEVIVVGGDVRAAQIFADRLPRPWQGRLVRTDQGSRAAGADESGLDDATLHAVAEVAERHVAEAVERFQAQRGDAAASGGLAAVVSALQRGQVDTVLLVDDPSSTDELWIGPEAGQVSVAAEELTAMGVREPVRVRADAALLRAVVGTDAALVLVPAGTVPLPHGIGAVLRYADAGTRTT